MLPEAASGSLRPAWMLNILLVMAAGLVVILNGPKTLAKGKTKYTHQDDEGYLAFNAF
jgi:hypothetical protein